MTNQSVQIYQALADMQKDISETGVAKTLGALDRGGKELYKFRGIDAVYNLLSPVFAKYGIVIGVNCLSREREVVQTRNSIKYNTLVTVEYTFTSRADGSKHSVTMFGEADDHSDKGTAKALSMAFKYACFQVFCIPVCDDPDGIVHDPISVQDYNDSRQNLRYERTEMMNNRKQLNQGQNRNQQHAQQQGQQTINEEQANHLIRVTKAAGYNPRALLEKYQIGGFGLLKIQDYNEALGHMEKIKQAKEQQQAQQGNQQQAQQRKPNTYRRNA